MIQLGVPTVLLISNSSLTEALRTAFSGEVDPFDICQLICGRYPHRASSFFVGGVDYGPQIRAFESGVALVVGTPGRVLDHLIKGTLKFDALRMLVFDEADRMLSMGFYPDMRRVRGYMPQHRVNSHLFSATFPSHVLRLSGEFLIGAVKLPDHQHRLLDVEVEQA